MNLRMHRLVLAGILSVALSVVGGDVCAQATRSDAQLAQAHFRRGSELFRAGHYEDAAREFQTVFDTTAQASMLFNIGRTRELAGDTRGALEAYEHFVALGAPDVGADQMEPILTDLRRDLARQTAGTVSPTPNGTPACAQGTSSVAAAAPLLQLKIVHVEYQRTAVNEIVPFVIGASGLILGGLAAWQGVSYQNDLSLFQQANRGEITWGRDVQNAYVAAPREVITAIALGASGGALLIGGVIWLAARGRGERHETVEAMVHPSEGGWMFTLGGRM